jgi:hypothetical protein
MIQIRHEDTEPVKKPRIKIVTKFGIKKNFAFK